jgi:hypothetical protein
MYQYHNYVRAYNSDILMLCAFGNWSFMLFYKLNMIVPLLHFSQKWLFIYYLQFLQSNICKYYFI